MVHDHAGVENAMYYGASRMRDAGYITRAICCFVPLLLMLAALPASAQQTGSDSGKKNAWNYRCSDEDRGRVCEIAQRLSVKKTGQRVVEVAIARTGEDKQKLRAVLILPLGVSTQAGVTLRVDDRDRTYRANISHCLKDGCYVYLDVTDSLLEAMKKGREARLAMRTYQGKTIRVNLSLMGFTRAYARLMNRGSEARKFLEAEGR